MVIRQCGCAFVALNYIFFWLNMASRTFHMYNHSPVLMCICFFSFFPTKYCITCITYTRFFTHVSEDLNKYTFMWKSTYKLTPSFAFKTDCLYLSLIKKKYLKKNSEKVHQSKLHVLLSNQWIFSKCTETNLSIFCNFLKTYIFIMWFKNHFSLLNS